MPPAAITTRRMAIAMEMAVGPGTRPLLAGDGKVPEMPPDKKATGKAPPPMRAAGMKKTALKIASHRDRVMLATASAPEPAMAPEEVRLRLRWAAVDRTK